MDWWVLVGTDTEASSVILDFRAGESGTPTTIECVFDPTVWTLRGQVNGARRPGASPLNTMRMVVTK
ncbi:hypothetical protein CDO52_26955 [Nocardiopsis gilva YIM 90087]|uniref:Uncharacterized protein n=1 Tax=Nocardiopsis gilva YIM 90087 TaxID=1235441 RepID=A0A223SCS2_9ACTN|nr:hypothetical protein [Nocardiopsis gilva]ASU85948.1 hypothetical protein CDO52_26955 [Nocardiopsis gilva YIM 90087]